MSTMPLLPARTCPARTTDAFRAGTTLPAGLGEAFG